MKRRSDISLQEAGFTMVELLIAIIILSTGLLGVAKMQGVSLSADSFAYNINQGTNAGQDKIEELVTMSYDDSELSVDSHEETSDDGLYLISWVVTDGTLTNTKEVNLTVERILPSGNKLVTEMTYLKARLI